MNAPKTLTDEELDCSAEFIQAFDSLEHSEDNLFITGKAGTGKSTFLEYFRNNTKKRIAVVAPTGVSALNVKGQTIHSFFKFKPRLITPDSITTKKDNKLYKNLDMLIIDEISMVRADVFDGIEYFLRLNGPDRGEPFGGVQLCVIGDLYQLPPIVTSQERDMFFRWYKSPFFFGAEAFNLAQFGVVELTKVYRQSERNFIEALNRIRTGDNSKPILDFINQRYVPEAEQPQTQNSIVLTTTNKIADTVNQQKLDALSSPEFTYMGKIDGNFGVGDDKLPAPQELRLKVGTQVMFTKNHQNRKWVNGTIGTVESLSEREIIVSVKKGKKTYCYNVPQETWETVKYSFDEEEDKIVEDIAGEYKQYPLMPAWGITIHKSQGKTLDHVVLDLGAGAFSPGQLYVALSRCRSFEDLYLKKPITYRDVKCDNTIVQFSQEFVNSL